MAQPTAPPGMPGGLQQASAPGAAPPPPAKKPGLFAPKPKPGAELGAQVADLAAELNNINRRLRILEERYSNLRRKTQVTDQNMLNANKKIMVEIQTAHSEADEFKRNISDMKEKLKIMIRELKECAKHQDVLVLQKYINLWEPINFITREAANKMIRDEVVSTFRDLNVKLQEEAYIKEQVKLALEDLKK